MLGKQSDLGGGEHPYLDHVGRDSFYGFLASHRGEFFRDEDFADLYCSDSGRPSVPPSIAGWSVSPRKSLSKSPCASSSATSTPLRAKSRARTAPPGPPPSRSFAVRGGRFPLRLATQCSGSPLTTATRGRPRSRTLFNTPWSAAWSAISPDKRVSPFFVLVI